MTTFRKLTAEEIGQLEHAGNRAQAWSAVEVSEDFTPSQCLDSRFEGAVRIGSGARIRWSKVSGYRLGDGCLIEGVGALECRHASAFGNGVRVATMNECGGRTVTIYDRLSAQIAYLVALWRHRPQAVEAIGRMIERHVAAQRSPMGEVGAGARVVGARFVREVRIGRRALVEGAAMLENGTVADGATVGVGVDCRDFILAEGARVDRGCILERCFVGEGCLLDRGFTACDSLFFANSNCENGEAVSVFAAPYTVSHHKSTLLIAGMFSFFNAGSGTNQSNHLFKSGAVHQSVHLRGCKFGSNAYVMAPAIEAPFTLILGRHTHHHDTSIFPYSYLVESDGRSQLMPGASLISSGTMRDLQKWPSRDRRTLKRDRIDFDPSNPYLCGLMIRAVETLEALNETDPHADTYHYNKVTIRSTMLQRGLKLYRAGIDSALGAMLDADGAMAADGSGRWIDAAGQYLSRKYVDTLLDAIETGSTDSIEQVEAQLDAFARRYRDYAHDWAMRTLARRLGHAPAAEELRQAIEAGTAARDYLRRAAEEDLKRDCSPDMAVGYGVDADDAEQLDADYRQVRGLNR